MSNNQTKNTRLQSIEKTVEELKTTREENHKNIHEKLQEFTQERNNFYKQMNEILYNSKINKNN